VSWRRAVSGPEVLDRARSRLDIRNRFAARAVAGIYFARRLKTAQGLYKGVRGSDPRYPEAPLPARSQRFAAGCRTSRAPDSADRRTLKAWVALSGSQLTVGRHRAVHPEH